MKDVGVEQIERVAGQLVGDPRQPPGREERVAVVEGDVRAHATNLGIGHHHGERGKQTHDEEATDDPPLALSWLAFQRGRVRRIVAERTGGLVCARDSRDDATWQRRCAYKNMTRQDENARPEQNAPFRFDGHAEPAWAHDESAVNRDVGSE